MLCANITHISICIILCWQILTKVTAYNTNGTSPGSGQYSPHSNVSRDDTNSTTAQQIPNRDVLLNHGNNNNTVPYAPFSNVSELYRNQHLASDLHKSHNETSSLHNPANISKKTNIKDTQLYSGSVQWRKHLTALQKEQERNNDARVRSHPAVYHNQKYKENLESQDPSEFSDHQQKKEGAEYLPPRRIDHVFASVFKTVSVSVQDPEDELNDKAESVSAPKYPQRKQESLTEEVNEELMGLAQWMNNTKKNQLKRRKREVADGDGLVILRRPVTDNLDCRCKACVTSKSSYSTNRYENAAFNKPVISSSSGYSKDGVRSLGACGAVNGNITGKFSSLNCFHTSVSDNRPWWRLDLVYVYSFQIMHLFRRQNSLGGTMLAGTDIRVDGALCFQFDSYKYKETSRNIAAEYQIACTKIMTGRSVTFEKTREKPTEDNHFIYFCELQIWVCKPGMYGGFTSLIRNPACVACPKECKYTCDNVHGCAKRVLYNVAFKKPVIVAQRHRYDSHALFGTDGVIKPKTDFQCAIAPPVKDNEKFIKFTVFLKTSFKIFWVTVYGARQCCSEQYLRKLNVLVSNSRDALATPPSEEKCGYIGAVPTRGKVTVTCPVPIVGRYVHLTKPESSFFTVCELQAYGHHRYILSLGAQCSAISEVAVCLSTCQCDKGRCRIKAGNPCRNDEPCVTGFVCDRARCKLEVGKACDPNKDDCKSGTKCDASSRICTLGLNTPCSKGQCESRAECDTFSVCKLKESQPCKDVADCGAGAKCSGGVCVCDTSIAILKGDHCEPAAGRIGASCTGSDCQIGQCQEGKCACPAESSTFAEDFSCKLKAGSSCSGDSDCNAGMKCEKGQCKFQLGGNCYGNSQSCTSGTTCESGTCKVKTGDSCANHEDLCLSGSICDDGTCKIELGEDCKNGKDDCVIGICSSEDGNKCKLNEGQNCTSHKQCRNGTSCENLQVCKIDLRQPCSDTSVCQSGTTCIARQGSSDKKCRKPIGEGGCRNDEDCVDGTICDNQKRCMIGKNDNCQKHPGLCLIGALCTGGKCQCIQKVTNAESEKCDPKPSLVGGACIEKSGSEPCKEVAALCGADYKCRCTDSFDVEPTDLTCRTKTGFPCSLDKTLGSHPCISRAACTDGTCVLKAGTECFGEGRGYCQVGTVCDIDGVCRLNLHQNCSGLESNCRLDIICDSLKRCKLKPGNSCRSDEECMAGAHCDNGTCVCTETVSTLKQGTCELNEGLPGAKCTEAGVCEDTRSQCNTDGVCQCHPEYAPDARHLSCSKVADEQCSADSECTTGMICDPASSQCKIQLGQLCDRKTKDYCMTGTVCDFDSVCKLGLKGNCSGANFAFCRSGTFCDWLEQCSNGVGDSCSITQTEDTCIAGANCINSSCVCDVKFAFDHGATCEPVPGRYGAPCGTGIGGCEVEHSKCTEDVCVCDTGYKPDRMFTCVSGGKSRQRAGKGGAYLAIGVAVGCLLFGIISFLAYRRHQHQKAARQEIISKGKAVMQDLETLSQSVTDVRDVPGSQAHSAATTSTYQPETSTVTGTQSSAYFTETETETGTQSSAYQSETDTQI